MVDQVMLYVSCLLVIVLLLCCVGRVMVYVAGEDFGVCMSVFVSRSFVNEMINFRWQRSKLFY